MASQASLSFGSVLPGGILCQGRPDTATTPATVVCGLLTLFQHCSLFFFTGFNICPAHPENTETRHRTENSLEGEEMDQPTKKPPLCSHLKKFWIVEETTGDCHGPFAMDKTSHSWFFHVFVLKTYLICAVQKYFIRIFKSAKNEDRAQLEEKWNSGTKQGTQIINGSKGISLEWLHSIPLVEKMVTGLLLNSPYFLWEVIMQSSNTNVNRNSPQKLFLRMPAVLK